MIFFYVLKNFQVSPRGTGKAIQFKSPRLRETASRNIPVRNIYFTTRAQFDRLTKSVPDAHLVFKVLDDLAVDMTLNRDDFPREIRFHQAGEQNDIFRQHAESVKIAVINGMGIGIGDSIVGLRALEIFYERIHANYSDISIDMFQRIKPGLHPLYQRNKSVNKTYDMPQPLTRLLNYDYYMTLEAFTQSKEFGSMPMADYFLAKLGIDPSSVNDSDKRNSCSNPVNSGSGINKSLKNLLLEQKNKGERFLLIHPVASDAIRSIPADHVPKLIDFLISNTEFILVGAVDFSYKHERFLDVSRYSKNIDDFIFIISQMDAAVTVDTSVYHIADCFGIPAVVLFNTIHPRYRISYYPNVRSMWLGEGKDRLLMRHKGMTKEDQPLLDGIYKDFNCNQLLTELNAAIKSA